MEPRRGALLASAAGLAVGLVVSTLGQATPVAASTQGVPSPAALPVLVAVSATHVGDADRVVFRFRGGVPGSVAATWVPTLVHDGSGLPVRVAGAQVLSVVMHGAVAHDAAGATTRGRTAFPLPNVVTAVEAGDFEGVVTFGLGVQKRSSFTVTTEPRRVVVEVGAAFPTATRSVWLVDRDAFATGQEPYAVPVNRPLRASAPAAAALHALFAGPTPLERADGLRLVRSRAWGFDHLSIVDGIARLRLTHGCASAGSTLTVAAEIMPTLKQFPSVDWVKIYGPGGRTESPTGPSDSIPTCLEP